MFNWLWALFATHAPSERMHNLDFASLLDRLSVLEATAQDVEARVRALEDALSTDYVWSEQTKELCNCICHSGKFKMVKNHQCRCKEAK